MLISEVIGFLEAVKERDGDLRLQTITGFWTRVIPPTGEKMVIASVGDGRTVADLLDMQKVSYKNSRELVRLKDDDTNK